MGKKAKRNNKKKEPSILIILSSTVYMHIHMKNEKEKFFFLK